MLIKYTHRSTLPLPRPIVLLDICSIALIKNRNTNLDGKGEKSKRHLNELQEMAQSGLYRFSLLLAILEKGTDYTNELNSSEMVTRFTRDHAQIVDFIGSDNLVETAEALENMIPILMDDNFSKEERAELSVPYSLELLDFYNRELRVTSTPPKHLRLRLAEQVAAEGERLGLQKGYPTIAICIASIYGCEEARGILKIKQNVADFNPSNCLGDIMSFYRVGQARFTIKKAIPTARVLFRTEDIDLQRMHMWFSTCVTSANEEGSMMKTTCEAPEKLLPALYKKGECINQEELVKIYALLDYKV